ncbi:MAG: hypothetical protein IKJ91_06190 [Clostridia bacterium]|nr:hypothetical protein [Clostridia bacterium]
MSDIKNVVFRSAIGGYNKSDVNNYLVRSSAELLEREAAASERVERAENEVNEYINRIEAAEAELENAKNIIAEKDAEIAKLTDEKKLLEDSISIQTNSEITPENEAISKEDFDRQEAIIAKQFEEIEALKAEIEELKNQSSEIEITKEKYDELVKKAAQYDKTSNSIGETLISAKNTAEEIISAAREEARLLEVKAEKELEEKRRNIEETSKRAIESIFSKVSLAAAECRRDVSAVTSYTYSVIEKALEDIRSKAGNSEIKIKSYEDSIWRGVKEDLNGIKSTSSSEQKKATPEQVKRIRK